MYNVKVKFQSHGNSIEAVKCLKTHLGKTQLPDIFHIAGVHLHKGFARGAEQQAPQPCDVLLLDMAAAVSQHSTGYGSECQQHSCAQLACKAALNIIGRSIINTGMRMPVQSRNHQKPAGAAVRQLHWYTVCASILSG